MTYRVTGAGLSEGSARRPPRVISASGRSPGRTILCAGFSHAPSDHTPGPERTANKLVQRTGAQRCDFMSHEFYNIFGSGQSPLSAPVGELFRSAALRAPRHETNFDKRMGSSEWGAGRFIRLTPFACQFRWFASQPIRCATASSQHLVPGRCESHARVPPNKRAAGNGGIARRFQIRHPWSAVPEHERSARLMNANGVPSSSPGLRR